MNEHFFTMHDAEYAYTVVGEGEPIVLLHGFTGSRKTWHSTSAHLAKGFQVITIDLPGHGRTSVKNPKTMQACCQDIALLLDYLQLDRVHILGYSMGGRTALSFAMLYPERIKTLILESASPGLDTASEQMKRRETDKRLAARITSEGLSSFVAFWESIPLFHTQKSLPAEVQLAIRTERLSQSKAGLAMSLAYMGTGSQPSWWQALHTLKIPVLLLAGSLDEKFVQINRKMEKAIPNVTYVIIENVGHAIHIEQVEKFVQIVMDFLIDNKN